MTNEQVDYDGNSLSPALVEAIASEVAGIINQRLSPKEVLKLFQVVFLDVEEAAILLRVKPKTISTWISQDRVPVRYAGGRPIFFYLNSYNGHYQTAISMPPIDSLWSLVVNCYKPAGCKSGKEYSRCRVISVTRFGITSLVFVAFGMAAPWPEARTKWQAERAETRARDAVFRGRYSDKPILQK